MPRSLLWKHNKGIRPKTGGVKDGIGALIKNQRKTKKQRTREPANQSKQ